MEDLIRRSDAIKAVIEWYGCKPNDIEAFEKIIEAIPSAESTGDLDNAIYEYVKEGLMDNPYDRPQGGWKINNNGWAYCSKCGRLGLESYDFCPYCGARMFAKDTNVPNKKGADDGEDIQSADE